MSKLFRSLFVLTLLLSSSLASSEHLFLLAKDQIGSIEIKERSDNLLEKATLRWTLYTNERLILLVNYASYPSQYTLQQRYKRNSIKIELRDDYGDRYARSFLRVRFLGFEGKRAKLKVSLHDPKKRFGVKYIDPR